MSKFDDEFKVGMLPVLAECYQLNPPLFIEFVIERSRYFTSVGYLRT